MAAVVTPMTAGTLHRLAARLVLPCVLPCVVLLAACGSSAPKQPAVPAALKLPPDQDMFLQAEASGVQVYECQQRQGQGGGHGWVFRAPDAALTSGWTWSGKHYAGPTWEAPDGSRVLGEVKASSPSPDPSAIPWLLLGAKATFGKGVLTQTVSIHRVATRGGIAPAEPCGAANANAFARVPYTATYYFYRKR